MKRLSKSILLSIFLTGCSSTPTCPFDSDGDTCEEITITVYLAPVIADLDYKNIRGIQNQVIIQGGFEHALSVPGNVVDVVNKVLTPSFKTFPLYSNEKPITETETIIFEFNHASVPISGLNKLKDFVSRIDSSKLIHVEIEGHTDSIGSSTYNKSLSIKRARAVSYYLIQHGIKQSKISIEGYGEDMPIMPNDTEDHRSKNRRAEIITKSSTSSTNQGL
jgi:outer membrane protein OmpA-like peptidoglycan-associated protein